MDDKTLFETIRTRLFTAVVGDVLDKMGHRKQFLPPYLRPLSAASRPRAHASGGGRRRRGGTGGRRPDRT